MLEVRMENLALAVLTALITSTYAVCLAQIAGIA